MKSITIHKVEDPIVELIKQRADAEGIGGEKNVINTNAYSRLMVGDSGVFEILAR